MYIRFVLERHTCSILWTSYIGFTIAETELKEGTTEFTSCLQTWALCEEYD
jgi:hypothetical protein